MDVIVAGADIAGDIERRKSVYPAASAEDVKLVAAVVVNEAAEIGERRKRRQKGRAGRKGTRRRGKGRDVNQAALLANDRAGAATDEKKNSREEKQNQPGAEKNVADAANLFTALDRVRAVKAKHGLVIFAPDCDVRLGRSCHRLVAHVVFAVDGVAAKNAETLHPEKENNLPAQAAAGGVYVPVNLSYQNHLVHGLAVNAEILGELLVALKVPVLGIDVASLLRLVKHHQRTLGSLGDLLQIILAKLVLGAVLVKLAQVLEAVIMKQGIYIVGREAGLAMGHEPVSDLDRINAGDVVVDMAALAQGHENMVLESHQAFPAALVAQKESDH